MTPIRLVKNRRLKNAYQSRAITSEPRPASRPDLRRYPVPKRSPAPDAATPPDRREFRSNLRQNRPEVTRWRLTSGGVCDRTGDVVTATLQCTQCGSWFSVDRRPAVPDGPVVIGSWPDFCSPDCRQARRATRARRNARRRRHGGTDGTQRPDHREFDPAGMRPEDAYELACRIVELPARRATPTAVTAAWRYIDEFEAESRAWERWWKTHESWERHALTSDEVSAEN